MGVGSLHSDTLYLLLAAVGAVAGGSLFVFFRLSNTVAEPVNALAEFAEQVAEGDFEARLEENSAASSATSRSI